MKKSVLAFLLFVCFANYLYGQERHLYNGFLLSQNEDTVIFKSRGQKYNLPASWFNLSKSFLKKFRGHTYEELLPRIIDLKVEERDDMIKEGLKYFREYSEKNSPWYDENYADKLKVIHEMIGDDMYLLLAEAESPPPPKKLWIVEIMKNSKIGDYKEKRGKITIALDMEERILHARNIRIIR